MSTGAVIWQRVEGDCTQVAKAGEQDQTAPQKHDVGEAGDVVAGNKPEKARDG
ncbi:hypothetical protein [Acidicapsa acidisoli]|uniref:hypothetical protein n=1 Tax=Acidicapsa acidisoli TaxID=1615681 RepID=UPI0021DFE639|nr:hypothetical protein [Acidicapsa acidisoli]